MSIPNNFDHLPNFPVLFVVRKTSTTKIVCFNILRNEEKNSLTNFDGIIIHIAQKGCCFTLSVHAHMHLTSHCGRICQRMGGKIAGSILKQ